MPVFAGFMVLFAMARGLKLDLIAEGRNNFV